MLHHMAEEGNLEMCEKLLELGAKPNSHCTVSGTVTVVSSV